MKRGGGRDLALLPVGFLIACVGAICGIGGGLFTVPILHFVRGLELKRAVATALVLVLTTTSFSTVGELLRDAPQLHLSLVAFVAGGALIGAQIGFAVAERIPARALRAVFVVVLLAASYKLAFGGQAAPADAGAGEWLDSAARVRAFVAGVGGGFLAPLLGVGGGLLMVPALFLGIPGIGFNEARATSLAAGAVGALRSVILHGRAGRIEVGAVAPLAVGAIGGALVGVQLVHLGEMVEVGRRLLAAILAFVALRFLRDLVRAGDDAAD
ncbi:MAG: sulfite exporter TauE/SafE family protein [Planctomycetota bacterium]